MGPIASPSANSPPPAAASSSKPLMAPAPAPSSCRDPAGVAAYAPASLCCCCRLGATKFTTAAAAAPVVCFVVAAAAAPGSGGFASSPTGIAKAWSSTFLSPLGLLSSPNLPLSPSSANWPVDGSGLPGTDLSAPLWSSLFGGDMKTAVQRRPPPLPTHPAKLALFCWCSGCCRVRGLSHGRRRRPSPAPPPPVTPYSPHDFRIPAEAPPRIRSPLLLSASAWTLPRPFTASC